MLLEVGVGVEISLHDAATFSAATFVPVEQATHNLRYAAWTTVTGDAWYSMRVISKEYWPPVGGGCSYFSDPEVEELWTKSGAASTLEERNALYAEILQRASDLVAWVPLYDLPEFTVARSYVKGIYFEPAMTIWLLRETWLDK